MMQQKTLPPFMDPARLQAVVRRILNSNAAEIIDSAHGVRRLADARLPGQQRDGASAPTRVDQLLEQGCQLRVASDKRRLA
jgi:hypothetical protein